MRALVFTVGFLFFALSFSACASEVQEVRFLVTVQNDQGAAQSDASIELDGMPVASTDQAGKALLAYQAHANRARISVRCAEGYHSPEPRSVPLSRRGRQPPLELEFTCRPTLRSLLLVVRAPLAEGLPVLANGEAVGTVLPDGTLHAVLARAPDSDIRITLDTTMARSLVPQHPVREIKIQDEDEIIVFDQVLSPTVSKPRRTSAKHAVANRHIPYAIGATR